MTKVSAQLGTYFVNLLFITQKYMYFELLFPARLQHISSKKNQP